jgi:hypothetical protein
MKKRRSLIAVLTAVVLVVFNLAAPHGQAASKDDKGSAQTNSKTRDSSNGPWRADPEKGWVRDERRHEPGQDSKEKSRQHRKGNNRPRSY